MFGEKNWSFTGVSGTEYTFAIRRKSEGLPHSAGVFILAYTHLRGHMAGWQVNFLHAGHADNMDSVLEDGVELDRDQESLWNSSFVFLEPDPLVRKRCLQDLLPTIVSGSRS